MKKKMKPKELPIEPEVSIDVVSIVNEMKEKIVSLEKKIDILISRPQAKPQEERHFQKSFQRFDNPRHHDRGRNYNESRGTSLTNVICAECGMECQVPFKPSADRPVYCKDCFSKRKTDKPFFKDKYNDKPREENYFRERFDRQRTDRDRKPGRKRPSSSGRRK